MSHCDLILAALRDDDRADILKSLGRERWEEKIVRDGDCWIWTGSRSPQGYAHVSYQCRSYLLHRLLYEAAGGILDERILHHTCERPSCVNPSHLVPVTRREHNVELHDHAGIRVGWEKNRSKTHCAQGHEFNLENTIVMPQGSATKRRCRTCAREWNRAYKTRRPGPLPPEPQAVAAEQLTLSAT